MGGSGSEKPHQSKSGLQTGGSLLPPFDHFFFVNDDDDGDRARVLCDYDLPYYECHLLSPTPVPDRVDSFFYSAFKREIEMNGDSYSFVQITLLQFGHRSYWWYFHQIYNIDFSVVTNNCSISSNWNSWKLVQSVKSLF